MALKTLKDATLDDIMEEIRERYKYKGGCAGMSVVVTDSQILVSRNGTVQTIAELSRKLQAVTVLMMREENPTTTPEGKQTYEL